jgi:osmotically-inducible protein OsmY
MMTKEGDNPNYERFTRRSPRDYRRADASIREEINECLTRDGEIDAGRIQVSVDNGEVTLSGTVGAREERRLAEAVAQACLGVKGVRNKLRVVQNEAQ